MSAPISKSQMAFELPKLSYIDTRWEEPAVVAPDAVPAVGGSFTAWVADKIAAVRAWNAERRALAELQSMSDRELFDVGLNRGDFARLFDDRFNQDLRARGR
jgi:uncharacterized protein YjiS (DUF1127 family)